MPSADPSGSRTAREEDDRLGKKSRTLSDLLAASTEPAHSPSATPGNADPGTPPETAPIRTYARQKRAHLYVEHQLDQARTVFHRHLAEVATLTGNIKKWSACFNPANSVVVHHDMEPIPENDHKFPLRDPADPLGRVHPRYAGDDGKCHPNVKISNPPKLRAGIFKFFKTLAKNDPRFDVEPSAMRDLLRKLEDDTAKELARLIKERPETPRCVPRPLEESDVQPHERMLIGQHGLFVRRPEDPSERPTLSNGRILGIFMGARLQTPEEWAHTATTYPDFARYSIDAQFPEETKKKGKPGKNKDVTYSGMGATNSLAFANTALQPNAEVPAVDRQRVNAFFTYFDATLTDKDGQPRRERLVAMVALDNLFDGDGAEAQVLVDYGDDFLEHFRAPEPIVKTEPTDD